MAAPVEAQGARRVRAVTPSDTAPLPDGACTALYVGGAGDVVVIADKDTASQTWTAAAAGTVLPVCARQVKSSNTTATNILALYF